MPHAADSVTLLAGLLLPESILVSPWFAVLAAFVSINTVMYVTLAVAKSLPKIYLQDWLPQHYVRSETRSIHPDAEETGKPPARGHADGRVDGRGHSPEHSPAPRPEEG